MQNEMKIKCFFLLASPIVNIPWTLERGGGGLVGDTDGVGLLVLILLLPLLLLQRVVFAVPSNCRC